MSEDFIRNDNHGCSAVLPDEELAAASGGAGRREEKAILRNKASKLVCECGFEYKSGSSQGLLHFLNDAEIKCPECGKTMKAVKE